MYIDPSFVMSTVTRTERKPTCFSGGWKRHRDETIHHAPFSCNPNVLLTSTHIIWYASRETWCWMGVTVNKKQACQHLPPLHETETAARAMPRPVPTRENTTVDARLREVPRGHAPRLHSLGSARHCTRHVNLIPPDLLRGGVGWNSHPNQEVVRGSRRLHSAR